MKESDKIVLRLLVREYLEKNKPNDIIKTPFGDFQRFALDTDAFRGSRIGVYGKFLTTDIELIKKAQAAIRETDSLWRFGILGRVEAYLIPSKLSVNSALIKIKKLYEDIENLK